MIPTNALITRIRAVESQGHMVFGLVGGEHHTH